MSSVSIVIEEVFEGAEEANLTEVSKETPVLTVDHILEATVRALNGAGYAVPPVEVFQGALDDWRDQERQDRLIDF
jgi:hypothetical protein